VSRSPRATVAEKEGCFAEQFERPAWLAGIPIMPFFTA
jgi:hypothetical protein